MHSVLFKSFEDFNCIVGESFRRVSGIRRNFFWILKNKLVVLGFLSLIFSGCAELTLRAVKGAMAAGKVEEEGPPKSQLQIRELQTRMYDTPDTKMVLKTMLSVLQDDGFIVKEANVELGLLSATKDVSVESKGAAFWGTFFDVAWEKNAIVEATANVSEFGKQTWVRVNFQQKVHDSAGRVAKVSQIYDPLFYQEFFTKVDKGLFIQKETI